MVLALSVSSEIKTVGSYAGLAALFGLAILALLYFAQARETRRIAEWIEREEARRAGAPAQVPMPVAPPRAAVPVPGPPPAAPSGSGVTTAVPGVRRVAVPAAGVVTAGAAAAAAAVALTPEVEPSPEAPSAEDAGGATRVVAMPIAAPATPAAAGLLVSTPGEDADGAGGPAQDAPEAKDDAVPDALEAKDDAAPDAPDATAVRESPAAPDAEGTEDPRALEEVGLDTGEMDAADLPLAAGSVPLVAEPAPSAEPRRVKWPPLAPEEDPREAPPSPPPPAVEPAPFGPSTPAGARPRFPPAPVAAPAGGDATVRSAGAAAFGAPAAIAAPAPEPTRRRERERERADPSPADDGGGNRSIASTLRLLLAAIVIVVALILVAQHVFGGSSKPTPSGSSQRTSSTSHGNSAPAPSTVTVSVLNGTHTAHLAGSAWAVLSRLGYRQGTIADAPAQNHRITFVAYTGANRPAAVEVANALKIATVHVHSTLDQASLAAAKATGATLPAVVVVLGANYTAG